MPPTSDTCRSWIALYLIKGLGNVVFRNLLEKFSLPENVFQANLSDLLAVEGMRKETALNIIRKRFLRDPEEEMKQIIDEEIRVITYSDISYPPSLKTIYDAPMLIYLKGKAIPQNYSFIGIVGSRNATHYGLGAAEKFAQGLSRRGFGIVSGMAKGIDSSAHWGCITAKGFTVAVLGTGIDIIYPPSNEKLFQKICEKGAIITEFPLRTRPVPNNFPIRNRIISGLSRGVIVIEATKNSGSLITASLALEQGREVFAVPGSINSFKSNGCHFLIKQGAGLVENADDVLEGLGLNFPNVPKEDTHTGSYAFAMDESEKNIYGVIGEYPMHIDQIAHKVNFGAHEIAGTLTRMELKGIIKQLPGKMFIRLHSPIHLGMGE
ncbi:MAG: DNA-processing protein DprA [Deltaproteobacteria bacterium]|nr:DNA-processing protein DprA [Deltaproteobacteria bacterium]